MLPPDSGERAKVYAVASADAVYEAAISTITREAAETAAGHIDIVSLHGHAEGRALFSELADQLRIAVGARLRDGWTVRRLVSILNEERLDFELERIQRLDRSQVRLRAEVKALVADPVPMLAPLIVNGKHVFLGVEDPRDYAVKEGIAIHDAEAAELCTRYFNTLWSSRHAITLRTQVGLREGAAEELRRAIRRRQQQSATVGAELAEGRHAWGFLRAVGVAACGAAVGGLLVALHAWSWSPAQIATWASIAGFLLGVWALVARRIRGR